MTPRSVRNNNPGNIDRVKTIWNGEDRSPAALAKESRFCVFTSPVFGFRAIAITLQTYATKYSLHNIAGIITRWAPDNENDTAAYIAAVSKAVGVKADQSIDVMRLVHAFPIVKAIARHESGGDYWPDAVILEGLKAAGVRA